MGYLSWVFFGRGYLGLICLYFLVSSVFGFWCTILDYIAEGGGGVGKGRGGGYGGRRN